ncbi:MAG: hypothetical protein WDN24_03440 [Sphingomonas sp.]
MRFYGGLRKSIPITFWAMMAGTLAITGGRYPGGARQSAGDRLRGLPFEGRDHRGELGGGFPSAFWIGAIVALITSFYSWRLMFLTFWGKPRWAASEHIQHALHDAHGHGHDDHPSDEDAGHAPHGHAAVHEGTGGYHPHESPWPILVPLVLLSIGSVVAGFVFHGFFIEPAAGEIFWKGSVAFNEHLMHSIHEVPLG